MDFQPRFADVSYHLQFSGHQTIENMSKGDTVQMYIAQGVILQK